VEEGADGVGTEDVGAVAAEHGVASDEKRVSAISNGGMGDGALYLGWLVTGSFGINASKSILMGTQ